MEVQDREEQMEVQESKRMETESKGKTLNGTIREVIYWFAFDTKYSMRK